jgi:hypothetical protein
MDTVVRISDNLKTEVTKILPGLREDLQTELYTSIGFTPKPAFFSDNKVLHAFYNEAGKYLSMLGHTEAEVEHFISGELHATEENLKKIHRIATLALVQLAMW